MTDKAGTCHATRRFWIAALGLLALAAGGWWWWQGHGTLRPPDSVLDDVDPPIRASIVKAREEVRQKPRSAQAWGHLGMVFHAHDFNQEANICFAQAAHLDPAEPTWPYLRGRSLLRQEP